MRGYNIWHFRGRHPHKPGSRQRQQLNYRLLAMTSENPLYDRLDRSGKPVSPCRDSKVNIRHEDRLNDRGFDGVASHNRLMNIFGGFRYFHIRQSVIEVKRDGLNTNN